MGKYSPKDLKCIVTGREAEYHHIKTRGAGGPDEPWNMIPICRDIHSLWHSRGTSYIVNKFPQIKYWMRKNQWTYDDVLLRWTNGLHKNS